MKRRSGKFRILFEIDFKGNVSKEHLDAYEKCLNLEISMDEFCNFVRESSFKAYKNKQHGSNFKDETKLKISLNQILEKFKS